MIRPARAWALASLALAAALTAGCGSSGDSGPLEWVGKPILFTPETLPADRTLTGKLRNDSPQPLRIVAKSDIKVVDDDGAALDSATVFSQTYGHGLFPPQRQPGRLPEFELQRIGQTANFKPGQVIPVTISWRVGKGDGQPVRIDYGEGSLAIPERSL